jgi:hypothetical protein
MLHYKLNKSPCILASNPVNYIRVCISAFHTYEGLCVPSETVFVLCLFCKEGKTQINISGVNMWL